MREPLPYTGGILDRAPGLRADPGWLEARLASPSAVIIPMWSGKCLVADAVADGGGAGAGPVRLARPAAAAVLAAAAEPVLLGLAGDAAVFAVDLSGLDEDEAVRLAGAAATADMRALYPGLRADTAAELAYARGLLHWHREQRFCGACGGGTDSREGGHLRVCRDCGKLLFPRIEPAVITLVEAPRVAGAPDRCLFGRHRGAPPGSFSTLAGFAEIGESLEEAVRREIAEEAGVTVGPVTYRGSQPWPFPGGLMIGFRAVALSDHIAADGDELIEARWFTRSEILERHATGRHDSIGSRLIEEWLLEAEHHAR
jgi:NAD+ diphosphatase